MKELINWIHKYENHLSAGAMVVGFAFDNFFYERVDLPITHVVFLTFLAFAALSIAWWHYLEERTVEGQRRPKWRSILPILTQFCFGGLWSGFIIFYSRSATVATSWPFLLILGGMFLGNELFRKYHSQLVFNAVLYFFAIYSYMIFTVPVLTHEIGTGTFLLSGVAAVGLFAVFMVFLRRLGHFRFLKSVWPIRFWAGVLFILINFFYFINVLPPLPLALKDAGIYHSITKHGAGYSVMEEKEPWYTMLGFNPTIHVSPGEYLIGYTATFAPVALSTKVVHQWQRYDEMSQEWVTEFRISFTITGGRDGGYRSYSVKEKPTPGAWRLNVETTDGHLIGRIGFTVEKVPSSVPTTVKILE